jgi:hypothetical protein
MTYKEVVSMLKALNDDDHSTVDLKIERKWPLLEFWYLP